MESVGKQCEITFLYVQIVKITFSAGSWSVCQKWNQISHCDHDGFVFVEKERHDNFSSTLNSALNYITGYVILRSTLTSIIAVDQQKQPKFLDQIL